ncbi:Exosome complex exonuclease RRP44, putative [Perkinsus marinus ATCC 50983]|uniref:Exosome complex exonuclease RRP44, putative n=1 Tax=Perkinsus marinus (strain ATCC 50983 / TXsc) TaxID=423536 RepID=C5KX56_PERM5|nr:Exosome complex exonuclease RRP44, putative [Perkinsus marinus ATCC 50983]EER10912.1 Exosome complex exonuclease RRP44, putative [Perkinsus marinus ATCC 50983]|eukprot:XP_002779117.1 Exosome complex exonuclease RRP44, putative [Perkinsus marinus ATCC 50983]
MASEEEEEESAQLVACEIVEWEEARVNPKCRLVEHLGGVGTGVAEHRAVMERYGLTSVEYSEEIEEELKAKLPSSEAVVNAALKGKGPRRWDLRKSHRVVSIDPPSARDLDDALSVEVKSGGRLRIGVHVADVSHFVAAQSHLDREAARRAITVYMPHKTYPMLPRHLSENLCSLLPGEDRLAFSVFFTLDAATGDLCGDEPVAFGKSIIRSSARLSYDEVDAAMGAETKGDAFQIVSDRAILEDIRLLWDVAAKRNASRGDDTIRVSSSKVLANRLVAERLVEGIDVNGKSPPPILRQHPNTEAQVLETILPILRRGFPDFDWGQGRSLAELLVDARKVLPEPCFKALSFEAMVAFQMAQYVVVTDAVGEDTSHWALGLGRYMHFTSPIRRYADVLVHRLLTDLVCEGAAVYEHGVEELIRATSRCNQIRKGSLEADRECAYYFFSDYVRANYPESGMVLNDLVVTKIFPGKEVAKGKFTKDAIEVFVPLVGYSKSVSLEQIGVGEVEEITPDHVTFLHGEKRMEWKTLSVVSMNVVCPSGDDSVLKHWTLRLPSNEASQQISERKDGVVPRSIRKSSECVKKDVSKDIRKSSECVKGGMSKDIRKSSECAKEGFGGEHSDTTTAAASLSSSGEVSCSTSVAAVARRGGLCSFTGPNKELGAGIELGCIGCLFLLLMAETIEDTATPREVLQRVRLNEIEICPALWQWLLQRWVIGRKHHEESVARDSAELGAEVILG